MSANPKKSLTTIYLQFPSNFIHLMLKIKINYTFLGLNAILLGLNLVYWLYSIFPIHDSSYVLQIFHVFYTEFLLNGELPRWLPYNFYGLPSDYYLLICLSPAQYFALFIGKIFNIKNTLNLFLFSVYLEQLQLLIGSYLLARKVFVKEISIFFMCSGIILSSFWPLQIFFNLRMFRFLPLTLFLVLKFSDKFNFVYLGLTGLTIIFSLFGNAPYFLPVLFYLPLLFLTIVLLTGKFNIKPNALFNKIWRHLSEPWALLSFVGFLFIALCYFHLVSESVNYSFLASEGRDPNTGKVPLSQFLTYGGSTSIIRYLEFLWGKTFNTDSVVYLGLIPIVFLVYSFFHVRNKVYYASCVCCFVILTIGLGRQGLIAPIIYHLPLVGYYRHIALLIPIAKIFLLICASFGIDHFYSSHLKNSIQKNLQVGLIICTGVVLIGIIYIYFSFDSNTIPLTQNIKIALVLFLSFIAVNIIFFPQRKIKKMAYFLMIFYILDISSWNLYQLFNSNFKLPSPTSSEYFSTQNYSLQTKRFNQQNVNILAPRASQILQDLSGRGALYNFVKTFANVDFCLPRYRQDFWNIYVNDFLEYRKTFHLDRVDREGSVPNLPTFADEFFVRNIACNSSKIRLAIPTKALEPELTAHNTLAILAQLDDPNLILISESNHNEVIIPLEEFFELDGQKRDTLSLDIIDFSLNYLKLRLEVKEKMETPLWLIYSDAFHPSWKAFLNGKEIPIFVANSAFKAIDITDLKLGMNEITFNFQHLRLLRAFLVTVMFLFASCLLVLTALNFFHFSFSETDSLVGESERL